MSSTPSCQDHPDLPTTGVPVYEVTATRPRQCDICVIIFVLNENGRLQRQLQRVRPYRDNVDVVIADGGSTDGSVSPELIQQHGANTVLVKKDVGGLGAQMRMAFAWALRRGYPGIITMDGNNKDDPEALPEFVAKLQQGYDHIQGSRFIPGGLSENLPLSRWLGLKLIHAPMIAWTSGYGYTDTTNGFRAYSRRFLASAETALFRDTFVGYELHYYLAIRAARCGFKVTEVPVARRYPTKGRIPTKISPIRGNLRIMKCLVSTCLGCYDP